MCPSMFMQTDTHEKSREGGECEMGQNANQGLYTDAPDMWVFITLSFQLFFMLEVFQNQTLVGNHCFFQITPSWGRGKASKRVSKGDFNHCERGGGNSINVNGIKCEKLHRSGF